MKRITINNSEQIELSEREEKIYYRGYERGWLELFSLLIVAAFLAGIIISL